DQIYNRSREVSINLLREKILLELENFKNRLKPESYVQHLIEKTHQKLLSEIPPNLPRMYADHDFAFYLFDSKLPENFSSELKKNGLSPLFFVTAPGSFEDFYYYSDKELIAQAGKDLKTALLSVFVTNISMCRILFEQINLKSWSLYRVNKDFFSKTSKIHQIRDDVFNYYISRFSDQHILHKKVYQVYSDFFTPQFLYAYRYAAISKTNVHGTYVVFIRQNSVHPKSIARWASKSNSDQSVNCSLTTTNRNRENGFKIENNKISFISPLPESYFSHINHLNKLLDKSQKIVPENLKLKLSASISELAPDQRLINTIIKFSSKLLILLTFALIVHLWLFGFYIPIRIHLKLVLVFAIIILLPVSATGILSYYLLANHDRLLEVQLEAKLKRKMFQLAQLEDENFLRLQIKILKFKRFLTHLPQAAENVLNRFEIPKYFPDIWDWFTYISFINEKGLHNGFREKQQARNKVIEALSTKFMNNQGMLKAGASAREIEFKTNLTMGLLESFFTPKMEEEFAPDEGIVQNDIAHSSDTHLGCLINVFQKIGKKYLLFVRTNNNEENFYKYLRKLNNLDPGFFNQKTRFGQIRTGIRLRKHKDYSNMVFPITIITNNEMNDIFNKAISRMSSGQNTIRDGNNLTIRAWIFRKNKSAVIVGIATTSLKNEISFLLALILPATVCYSILLLTITSSMLSEAFIKPVRYLQDGIEGINNNKLGITIKDMQIKEFSEVTKAFNQMSIALRQKALMSRYVSDTLIEKITRDCHSADVENKFSTATVLSCDIRNFTTLSEMYPPTEIVEMLNSYFTLMEEVIEKHGGTIDKYVGDAIQAVFFQRKDKPPTAELAVKAALNMRKALTTFNQERQNSNFFTIENGIGIATGKVLSGTIGSNKGRKIFTLNGEIIN
ncbi:MAG: adenylate/guanylate cyclase domain-containing protein, partial [Candidatus Rifleibacteriota bacterium]